MTEEQKITIAMDMAYEAGKWAGQVDLEESMDREQYAECTIETVFSKKNAMPQKQASVGREVSYRLRSEKWRDGVRKSSKESMEKVKQILLNSPPNE